MRDEAEAPICLPDLDGGPKNMGNTVSYHSSLESWGQDAQGHGRRHTSNMDVMVEKEKGPFVADRSEQEVLKQKCRAGKGEWTVLFDRSHADAQKK